MVRGVGLMGGGVLKLSAPGGYDDEAAFEEDEAAPAAKKRRGRALESDSEE